MAKINDLPESERPREKGLRDGVENLANRELLALLLRSGRPGMSVLEVADEVLIRAGGIQGLARLDHQELCRIPGISDSKALELEAGLELAGRIIREQAAGRNIVKEPEQLVNWLQMTMGSQRQEHFMVVYLDTALHILASRILFIGTLDASMVSPREILREALLQSAAGIILVHNHPSGSLQPSDADRRMTDKIMAAAELMDVQVLDHLIVSRDGCLSMKREGMMKRLRSGF